MVYMEELDKAHVAYSQVKDSVKRRVIKDARSMRIKDLKPGLYIATASFSLGGNRYMASYNISEGDTVKIFTSMRSSSGVGDPVQFLDFQINKDYSQSEQFDLNEIVYLQKI